MPKLPLPPSTEENNEQPGSAPKISPSEAPYLRAGFPLRHLRAKVPDGTPWAAARNRAYGLTRDLSGSLVVLWGPRGTGKTQLALEVARTVAAEKCLYRKASDIFRELRYTYRSSATQGEKDVFESFVRPFLLVIDEAQERGETDFEDRVLTQIVDRRYDAMLHTIIISNLTREALAKSLGSSIVSRAHEIGEVIECAWPSFREAR